MLQVCRQNCSGMLQFMTDRQNFASRILTIGIRDIAIRAYVPVTTLPFVVRTTKR